MATDVTPIDRASSARRAHRPLALRQPPFVPTDVLRLEEVALGVSCSVSQLYKVLPHLRVSYLLGTQSPRVVWQWVLDALEKSAQN